jgi:exonuclease VII small subunit
VAELKSLQQSINTPETDEDAFDVFCRSDAMQLKKLWEESLLLAQWRIQNILTEMRIKHFRKKNHSTST